MESTERNYIENCHAILRITKELDEITIADVDQAWQEQFSHILYLQVDPSWGSIIAVARDTLVSWLRGGTSDNPDEPMPSGVPRKPHPVAPEGAIALPLPGPESEET